MPNIYDYPIHLGLGATAIVQPEFTGAMDWYGAWHTVDIDGEASALFITAGLGTQHRAR